MGRNNTFWERKMVCAADVLLLLLFVFTCFTDGAVVHLPASSSSSSTRNHTQAPAKPISGVTGELFSGSWIRTFPLPLRFPNGVERGITGRSFSSLSKWAVCTTIHSPSEAILSFVNQDDWAIVIVGDEGMAPFNVSGATTVFLDVAAQEAMSSDFGAFLSLLPWRHFGRKNLGYLFAILHGAQVIWDFDDDNFLKQGRMPQIWETVHEVNVDETCEAFNPLPLMGGEARPHPMWPRGYPLGLVRRPCNFSLEAGDPRSVGVFQSLADHEPDVDGIYRLTRTTPMSFSVSPSRPALSIPRGTYSPFNAQATLFTMDAFWSLLLPVTVHGRVSDIWRSYVGQRLLWELGLKVAFTPPIVVQHRNPHDPLADMDAERDLYFKSLALVRHLRQWKGSAPTLEGRVEELYVSLFEHDFIEINDVLLAREWLAALGRVDYHIPRLSTPIAAQERRQGSQECAKVTTVLVTGISGMIGSHVARELVKKGCYQVTGLVRQRSNLEALTGILDRVTLVSGDIVDGARMLRVLEQVRPDYIYHFAAQAINGASFDVPGETLDTNVIGTMHILESVRRLGLSSRILIAGSPAAYGKSTEVQDGPLSEDAPLDPVSPYGVSKLAAEKLATQYFLSFGTKVVVARLFIQVGVGGTDSLAIHQFCKQVAMAELGLAEPVVRHGNLATVRDMTDVRDTAPLLIELAEQGLAGEVYNVGSGTGKEMQFILGTVLSLARTPMLAQLDSSRLRAYDERILLANTEKLRSLTPWSPTIDIRSTVEHVLNFWRQRVAIQFGVSDANNSPMSTNGISTTSTANQTGKLDQAKPDEPCPTENIDLFIATHGPDFPLTTFLMRSIELFMPCHGHIHIIVNAGEGLNLSAWISTEDPRMHVHELTVPSSLQHLSGYIAQAWVMMWADTFVQRVGSDADFVMFLDTDSVFGLPVTCRSLFSADGRVILAGWEMQRKQPQFTQCVNAMVGPVRTSYMAYFPFTVPMSVFPRMRRHITLQLGGTDFDSAFAEWSQMPGVYLEVFSQFAVMGAYMEQYERDRVQALFCESFGSHKSTECAKWVPPASHYGWRPCCYVDGCLSGEANSYRRKTEDDFSRFSKKFGQVTIDVVEQIISDGICIKHFLVHGKLRNGCSVEQSTRVNPELLPYPKDPPSQAIIEATFAPTNQRSLCFSVEAESKRRRSEPGQEVARGA